MSAFYPAFRDPFEAAFRGPFDLPGRLDLRTAVIQALSPDTFAIFDPSDGETRYQDSAGTTLADTSTNPIGLHLDVSQGLELGAELVADGGFDDGIAGWSGSSNAILSHTGSALRVELQGGDIFGSAQYSISTTPGVFYELLVTLLSHTSTSRFRILGVTDTQTLDPGSYKLVFEASATSETIDLITSDDGAESVWDNISVRELPGYHAVQNNTAEKPEYQVSGSIHSVHHDLLDDNIVTTLPDLGTDATVKYVTSSGITTLENQTISGDYTLPQATWQGVVIYEGPMSSAQAEAVDAWLNAKAGL